MTSWLDPVRAALGATDTPVTVFFRDDDAGWADNRLLALLDLFAEHDLPLDLAVIPRELRPRLADILLSKRGDSQAGLGLHMHGFTHENHEPTGRKCEFGASRTAAQQLEDLTAGKAMLQAQLGDALDPIFTPPWNRCTQATVEALKMLGIATLSRNCGAAPLELGPVFALDIAIDWLKQKDGERLALAEIGAALAIAVQSPAPLGIMLHHAVMDDDDLIRLAPLLALLARHPRVHTTTMSGFARSSHAASATLSTA